MSTTTMVFPRPVKLQIKEAGKRRTLEFKAGINEVPDEHVNHPYLAANGVQKYDAKKAAEEAAKRAQAAQKRADEAAAKAAKGKPSAPAADADKTGDGQGGDKGGNQTEAPNYDAKTVEELKDLLEARGIEFKASAKKADLVNALIEADEADKG